MTQERIEELVAQAVNKAYDAWAVEHPTLASLIDQINLTTQTVQRLRESPEYRDAVTAYRQSDDELDFLNNLLNLAVPVLTSILGA